MSSIKCYKLGKNKKKFERIDTAKGKKQKNYKKNVWNEFLMETQFVENHLQSG